MNKRLIALFVIIFVAVFAVGCAGIFDENTGEEETEFIGDDIEHENWDEFIVDLESQDLISQKDDLLKYKIFTNRIELDGYNLEKICYVSNYRNGDVSLLLRFQKDENMESNANNFSVEIRLVMYGSDRSIDRGALLRDHSLKDSSIDLYYNKIEGKNLDLYTCLLDDNAYMWIHIADNLDDYDQVYKQINNYVVDIKSIFDSDEFGDN